MKSTLQAMFRRGTRAFIANVEKLALLTAAVFLGMVLLDFFTRDRMAFTPEDMIALARDARNRIASAQPNPPAVFPYCDAAKHSHAVSPTAYALSTLLDPPLWQHRKRSSPALLPPLELLASAGHGLFAMTPMDGNVTYTRNGLLGQRWVVVTAAIPYGAQQDAFDDALGTASLRIAATDKPHYVYLRVERACVEPGAARVPRKWERLNVREMLNRQAYWHGQANEIVDQGCIPAPSTGVSLAFPLAPRKDAAWGAEVSHPRITAESCLQTPLSPALATAPEASSQGRSLSGQGSIPLASNQISAYAPDRAGVSQPDYLLLRFFDYSVEPGRRYCYRARLLLANPNFGVSVYHLDNQGVRAVRFLETPWSDSSQVVTVPGDDHILVVGTQPRGKQARLMLTHFAAEDGEIAFKEVTVQPGQLLNYSTDSIWRVDHPRSAVSRHLSEEARSEGSTRQAEYPDFTTGLLLLDVEGGRRLLGKERMKEPARVLLLDARGNLLVHDELDDAPASRRVKELATPIGDDGAIASKSPTRAESLN